MNASGRLNTCKSNGNNIFGWLTSGARVSNAYGIYLQEEDSPGKLGIILHGFAGLHDLANKVEALEDDRAYY